MVMQQCSENKYFDSQISVPAAFPSSTIVQFVYPWPVIDTLRLKNISLFFNAPVYIEHSSTLLESSFACGCGFSRTCSDT